MKKLGITFEDVDKRMNISSLWRRGYKGKNIIIAVIDTGINHSPDLDDVVIFDKDFTGEHSTDDAYMHGTKVAQQIHWIAPDARLANLKVWDKTGGKKAVYEAIAFCIHEYPRYPIINISLGFPSNKCHPPKKACSLCSIVNQAVEKGIFVVAAAGNSGPRQGTITCPGSAKNAFTVGATWSKEDENHYQSLSWLQKKLFGLENVGTSFSAPLISGGVALLYSAYRNASVEEIKTAILESSHKLPNAKLYEQGAGIPDFSSALEALIGASEVEYQEAKNILYYNCGNASAQRVDNHYIVSALEILLNFISKRLIRQGDVHVALLELKEIQRYLVSGALPRHEEQICDLIKQCLQES